jgi:hypothetical protein
MARVWQDRTDLAGDILEYQLTLTDGDDYPPPVTQSADLALAMAFCNITLIEPDSHPVLATRRPS